MPGDQQIQIAAGEKRAPVAPRGPCAKGANPIRSCLLPRSGVQLQALQGSAFCPDRINLQCLVLGLALLFSAALFAVNACCGTSDAGGLACSKLLYLQRISLSLQWQPPRAKSWPIDSLSVSGLGNGFHIWTCQQRRRGSGRQQRSLGCGQSRCPWLRVRAHLLVLTEGCSSSYHMNPSRDSAWSTQLAPEASHWCQ